MKSRKLKPKIAGAKLVAHKNFTRFLMLTLLTDFKHEIMRVREEFGIPSNGLESEQKAIDLLNRKNHGYTSLLPVGFYKEKPKNLFRDKMFEIGESFNLPFHFYHSSTMGLAWYILTNKIAVSERNWEITAPLLRQWGKVEWVALTVFMQLTDSERKDALKELAREQKWLLKPQVIGQQRLKLQFERDMEIFSHISQRTGLPRRQKRHSGYLKYLAKESKQNPKSEYYKKELKKREREMPNDVNLEYDQPLITNIASRFNISRSAASHALRRLNNLSISFFGKELLPKPRDTKSSS